MHFNIGCRSGVPGPGEFLVNTELASAEYAAKDSRGKTVKVCLTSVYDLAKYVVAAIEIGPGNWPREFTLRGDRLTLQDIVRTCSNVANSKSQLSHDTERSQTDDSRSNRPNHTPLQ